MKKRLIACLLLLVLSLSLPTALTQQRPLSVYALKGPTAMGLVKLLQDDREAKAYALNLAASPDMLIPAISKGEADLACLPVNLAAILYAKTKGQIRVVNINTLGVLYILEQGDSIHSLADLGGRTLYASGKASTPEYVLSHLLETAGVLDVQVEWKSEHAEVLTSLLADPKGVALLPQPFVTVAQSKQPELRVAIDLNQAWAEAGLGSLVTGVTVASTRLIQEEPERLASFLGDYQASVDWVNANNEAAAQLIEGLDILAAPLAQKALPACQIRHIAGQDMADILMPFYQLLYEKNPASVGGQVPDSAFYHLP